jgi:asparagine synthase (glutamine-hydrolysing)
MCGISAIYRFTAIEESDRQKMEAMNREMAYRGPDDNGTWFDEKCGMAQTRLSIIGLEKGKQPLFSEDKTVVLICNGEIYNYIELKAMLLKAGHSFSSDSDSEMIVHLYEMYGVDCLSHLRGQFAFCLWDSKKQQLFSARDRVGEKTLYYSQVQTGVVFSSELKAILKNYIDIPQIDSYELASSIRYMVSAHKDKTYIEQIKRIEPGQYILVNEKGIKKSYYWKRNLEPTFTGSFSEARKQTLDLLLESVSINLRSDVPVAVLLSGGVDSSAVAALAKRTGKDIHCITVGYKGEHACDERPVARQFAKDLGVIHHELEMDENDFKESFNELTIHLDEPVTDIAAVAQWALYKKVRKLGFKVLLGGMGGDEVFYGYGYWNDMAESLAIHRKHQHLFPWKGKKKEYLSFLMKNWKYILYAGYPHKLTENAVGKWMYDDYLKFAETGVLQYDGETNFFKDIDIHFSYGNPKAGKELDYIYEFLFSRIMTMAYLYLSDREGMGNSTEIRSPLLDYKLVEFVASLPMDYKYQKGNPKFLLKDVMSGMVPDYILKAPKRGFQPPPEFIKDIANDYEYKIIQSDYKFYNSILADRLIHLHVLST